MTLNPTANLQQGHLHIFRIAIWDWAAIQETIDPWYTGKAGPVPQPEHILKIAPQLAARIGKGVISTSHRVSAYKTKFVDEQTGSTVDDSGLGFAARMRVGRHQKPVRQ